MEDDEILFIKEELEEKREILENVKQAIAEMEKAKDNINEIEEKLTPGIYGHLDNDLSILENLQDDIEAEIEDLEGEAENYGLNLQWEKEKIQQEREYWRTQF